MADTKGVSRKQAPGQGAWLDVWKNIESIVPESHINDLISQAVKHILKTINDKKVAVCWSGGKDSIALEYVARIAGVEKCFLVIAGKELEYPAFLKWVKKNHPKGLEIIDRGFDLGWLAENQHMLFPQDGKTAAKWFKLIQHTGQAQYFKKYGLDMLLLGRRKADGNYTGKKGEIIYTNRAGVTRYSPIAHWRHEDVLALFHYAKIKLPPFYFWPNGFNVGTGAWSARQWTGSIQNGWAEVHANDKSIVEKASKVIGSAKAYLSGSKQANRG